MNKRLKDLEAMEEQYSNKLIEIREQIQAELNRDWRNGLDELELSCAQYVGEKMTIECDYNSWYMTKEKYLENNNIGIIHIEIPSEDICLSLESTKKLVEYLQQKIDFMEE